jgi:hypothetical protein
VQIVPTGKSDVGSRTKLFVPPGATGVTLKAIGVATGHSTVNAVESRIFTFSLKLIVMLVLVATCVAPFVGIVVVTAGGVSMVNEKTKLAAMLSGGSFVSWSVTEAAKTVTVQVSPFVKSVLGLIVKTLGPPVTTVSTTLRVPLVAQTI